MGVKLVRAVALAWGVAALAAPVCAQQDAGDVRLFTPDGAVDLSGTLLSFEDNVYVIQTSFGALRVSADRVECEGPGCPQAAVAEQDDVFQPGPVLLTTRDGRTAITGTLLSYDGATYRIQTAFGTIEVAADVTLCEGEVCPRSRVDETNWTIATGDAAAEQVVAQLLAGFAGARQASIDIGETDAGDRRYRLEANGSGLVADVTLSPLARDAVAGAVEAGELDLSVAFRPATVSSPAETVVALDALVALVAQDNPLRALSQPALADVLSGAVSDWSELGQSPGPINVYVSGAADASRLMLEDLLLGPQGAQLTAAVNVVSDDAAVAVAVEDDPRGLGFTGFAARGNARVVALDMPCGVQMRPDSFSVRSESYPLTQRFSILQPEGEIPRTAQEFVAFSTTSLAQKIVASGGHVSQDIETQDLADMGQRFLSALLPGGASDRAAQLSEFATQVLGAERLSVTFRFDPTTNTLDAKGRADIERLANLVTEPAYAGKRLLVIGFSASGRGADGLALSRARAQSVLAALEESGAQGLRAQASGYGELMPLDCGSGARADWTNDRVEIWLAPAQ